MGKHINKRVEVRTEFRKLTSKEWGQILALPFPPAARGPICHLFLEKGSGLRDLIFTDGFYSPQQQINQLFIKRRLPYRLRNYQITRERAQEIYLRSKVHPNEDLRGNYKRGWLGFTQTKLCTVTSYKVSVMSSTAQ